VQPGFIPIASSRPFAVQAAPGARPLAVSLVLHVFAVWLLANVEAGPAPQWVIPLDEAAVTLLDDDDGVLWLPAAELPAVQPAAGSEPSPPGRPRNRGRQRIVANDPAPDSSRQMIWTAAPEIAIEQDIAAPNLIAWAPPELEPPRFEWKSTQRPGPQEQKLEAEPAPEVEAAAAPRLDLPEDRPAPLRFYMEMETAAAETPERGTLAAEAAPEIAARASVEPLPAAGEGIGPRRYYMESATPQPPRQEETLSAGALPQVEASSRPPELALPAGEPQEPLRYFFERAQDAGPPAERTALEAPPPGIGNAADAARPSGSLPEAVLSGEAGAAGAPPAWIPPAAGGGGPGANVGGGEGGPAAAVAGLDPAAEMPESIPAGRRRGRFSSGPDGGPGGEEAAGSSGEGGARVPNLSVSGGAGTGGAGSGGGGRRASTLASLSTAGGSDRRPLDSQALLKDLNSLPRAALSTASAAQPPEGSGTRKQSTPTAQEVLGNKAIYAMAVNMPNLSSSGGSWLVEFSEADPPANPAAAGKLAPPAPRVKVDPKYVPSAARERIEGEVVLYAVILRDGTLRDVEVIKSLDERLDVSAVSALSKWRFKPAARGGEPVQAEIVVHIPFRLRPEEGPPLSYRKPF